MFGCELGAHVASGAQLSSTNVRLGRTQNPTNESRVEKFPNNPGAWTPSPGGSTPAPQMQSQPALAPPPLPPTAEQRMAAARRAEWTRAVETKRAMEAKGYHHVKITKVGDRYSVTGTRASSRRTKPQLHTYAHAKDVK